MKRRIKHKERTVSEINLDNLTLGQVKQLQSLLGAAAPQQAKTLCLDTSGLSQPERPVMVTTEFRGVFFGYATNTSGEVIRLKRARNCICWTSEEKGFLGLAGVGPGKNCRIGPSVSEIELRKVTSVVEVSPEAVKAWEAAPFAK